MLSGSASRHTSVTDSFDRESFNSVEQTFTVVVVSFMVAPTDYTDITDRKPAELMPSSVFIRVIRGEKFSAEKDIGV